MIYKRAITLLKSKNSKLSYEEVGRKFETEHIERINTDFRNRDRFVVHPRSDNQKVLALFSIVELQIVYGSIKEGRFECLCAQRYSSTSQMLQRVPFGHKNKDFSKERL